MVSVLGIEDGNSCISWRARLAGAARRSLAAVGLGRVKPAATTTFRTREEIEETLNVPILASYRTDSPEVRNR